MGECCRAGFINHHWCTATTSSSPRPADAIQRGTIPQHIAGKPKGDTKADEQQRISTLWTSIYHRCRDGALLLQRHPIEIKPHLEASCTVIKGVASQIDKLECAK
eukprot:8652551-Pyramimonas_sp.AAC.1